jgi:hypothetical protein
VRHGREDRAITADLHSWSQHRTPRQTRRGRNASRTQSGTSVRLSFRDVRSMSPAIHVRRPRLDYESHAAGLDRNELGALLVAAGLSSSRDHALVSLLALNGLRVSEATWRGHRRARPGTRSPDAHGDSQGRHGRHHAAGARVARTVDLAIDERIEGPLFIDSAGQRLVGRGSLFDPGGPAGPLSALRPAV